MKKLLVISSALMLSGFAMSQAKEGTADLQKLTKADQAVMIELPYAPSVVKLALYDFLSRTGKQEEKNAHGYLLSDNTELVRKNVNEADMIFNIVSDNRDPNASIMYLKLNSQTRNNGLNSKTNHFDMQDAVSYLNNFSVAIRPYATDLQIKMCAKDAKVAENKSFALANAVNRLDQRKSKIEQTITAQNNPRRKNRLSKRQTNTEQRLDMTMAAKSRTIQRMDDQRSAMLQLQKH